MNITSLIEVRAPYYALGELSLTSPGLVNATIQAEQPGGYELGVLPAAEAGRHLAIAGSCACASLEPEGGKHFYLAQRAYLRREQPEVSTSEQSQVQANPRLARLRVEAKAEGRSRRSATASGQVRNDAGQTLFSLDVGYRVLSEAVFERLFSAHRRDLRSPERVRGASDGSSVHLRKNPYLSPLPMIASQLDATHGKAALPEVRSDLCTGHFPMYPAMPIALLMHGLSSLSGDVLRARYGNHARYYVQEGEVRAEQLAFAGQPLHFEARWIACAGDLDMFEARARLDDGAIAGAMQLTLRRVLVEQVLQ
jgi:3-hydroxymyristoyl/3-hydroxydecanoyl-(acyl carrier protein) dehydratase